MSRRAPGRGGATGPGRSAEGLPGLGLGPEALVDAPLESLGVVHHIPRTPSARSLDAASVTDSSKGEDEHDHDDDDELLAYHHALSHHQHDRHRHYYRSISF